MPIRRPLDGMLVLDLGQIYNGPYCGLLLGFMGARVLKIEPPEGDVVRRRKREVEPYPLVLLNSNKESVVLDLKQPRGKQIFLDLVARADVVIENFAVGVMDRLGLGWEVLRKANPRLVYGGSSGFGLDGPYRDLAAMDVTIQAMSGIMNSTGQPDGPPTKAGAAVCDFLAGIHLCAGILGALVQRERTGEGQRVEVAMHEAGVIALASALGAVMDGDESVPQRTGNRHPALAMAPYNTYPCSDGHVAIFTSAERHWQSMCRLLGRPDLAANPEYSTTPGRAKHMAEIDDVVGAWTIMRSKEEVMRLLNEAHVPCAPVKTAREVARDPHLEARGFWVDVNHPRRGPTRVAISPIRLHTAGKAEIRSPAPTLGQHTESVLAELLGLKAEELAHLRAAGVTQPVTEAKTSQAAS
jgi:crotonobetainyl-CoA:carnitine CoA-transferase CaiB-like acyl-CoA transferase